MMRRMPGLAALALLAAAPLGAQAYFYPSFQPSRVAEREYNFAIVDVGGGGGTGIVVQWREGLGNQRAQFTLDAGFVDPDAAGADTRLVIGGGFAYQMLRERNDQPFDLVFTAGLGISPGDNITFLRVPVGVVAGHRFPLEGNFAITPYVHPRLSYDRVSFDAPGGGSASDSDLNLDVDIGANFEFNRQFAVRLSAVLGDRDAVGLSLAWTPRGLRQP